jgi:hypothetical protein
LEDGKKLSKNRTNKKMSEKGKIKEKSKIEGK